MLQQTKQGLLPRLAEAMADLPAFVSQDQISDNQLTPVNTIRAVAVWDTVGSMGIPIYRQDTRYDAFRFTDTKLSDKVQFGFHAISLDEQRIDFTPTLWDARSNIFQLLFPGARADVGGGYCMDNHESELSDIALVWMTENLQDSKVGVRFGSPAYIPKPSAKGTAHQPWRYPPFDLPSKWIPRNFKGAGIPLHPAINERKQAGLVYPDPKQPQILYAPTNIP